MSGRNLEDFFQDTAAFDALSDEDRARLFAGESLQGDTEAIQAEENIDPPADVVVDPEEIKPAEENQEPVVLAKDGQHTIPFAELEAARERNRQLEQELLALKSPPASQLPDANKPAEATDELAESNEDRLIRLRREEREAMYAADTDLAEKLGKEADALNRQIAKDEMRSENAAQEAERKAKESEENTIADALARANALIEKFPFLNPQGPDTNQKAIDLVVLQRDRFMAEGMSFGDAIEKAVGEIAPLFATNTTKQPNANAAAKAAEAISKAKTRTPTSLSQVPAGARAHHDEGEAIREMDINQLSRSLEGKSPDEIMKLMSRVL